jgi:hypothetical protein
VIRLFTVPNGRRVRVTSRLIRWIDDDGVEHEVARDATWTATTTEHYWKHKGVERRLLIDHTFDSQTADGIWQADTDCHVVG